MSTATTLGAALASAVSMLVIVACANGLRTIARCSMPGSWMLSVHLVRPVISRWSSLRRRALPISLTGGGCVLGDGHDALPSRARAVLAGRGLHGRTMLW